MRQQYEFTVTANVTAITTVTVEADNETEARELIEKQLSRKNSHVTVDLASNASEQIRKELEGSDFDIQLESTGV